MTGIVAALESSADPRALNAVYEVLGPERGIFSLDLAQSRPLAAAGWGDAGPEELASIAWGIGFRRLIVLDLARVGSGEGPGVEALCRTLRDRYPALELIAGGGVRGPEDLQRLADCGCDAALVATALHDGRLAI